MKQIPMLVFTHIPRTGGTSARNVIFNQIKNYRLIDSFSEFSFLSDKELNSYDFIATHCGYGIINRINRSHKKIILLRDPFERIVSHYFYLRKLENDVSYSSHYAKKLSLNEFICLDNSAVQISINNTQVWHLIEDKNIFFRNKYINYSDTDLLDIALSHLSTYDFVGFTHGLNSVLSKLFQVYEWDATQINLPQIGKSDRPNIEDLESDTIELILSKVSLDMLLYNKALELYDSM